MCLFLILDGVTIDVDCDLKDVHVYRSCHGYNFVANMALVDIAKNKNSYCRMQLLESDDEKQYENQIFKINFPKHIFHQYFLFFLFRLLVIGSFKNMVESEQSLATKRSSNSIV